MPYSHEDNLRFLDDVISASSTNPPKKDPNSYNKYDDDLKFIDSILNPEQPKPEEPSFFSKIRDKAADVTESLGLDKPADISPEGLDLTTKKTLDKSFNSSLGKVVGGGISSSLSEGANALNSISPLNLFRSGKRKRLEKVANRDIQNYLESIQQEGAQENPALNEPIIDLKKIGLSVPKQEYIKPAKTGIEKLSRFNEAAAAKLGELESGLLTPSNIAQLGAAMASPVAGAVEGAAYAAPIIKSAVKGFYKGGEALGSGDYSKAGENLTEGLASTLFAKGIGGEILKKIMPVSGRPMPMPEELPLLPAASKESIDLANLKLKRSLEKIPTAADLSSRTVSEAPKTEMVEGPRTFKKLTKRVNIPDVVDETAFDPNQREPYAFSYEPVPEPFEIKKKVYKPEDFLTDEIKPYALRDYVKESGGLRYDGENAGELRRIGTIKESGNNLLNKNGVDPDVMRRMANEEGFGPYETVSDFIDGLNKNDESGFNLRVPQQIPDKPFVVQKETPYPEKYSAKAEVLNKKIKEPTGFITREEVAPEAPKTVQLQMDSLKNNRSKAVLLTPGEQLPANLPKRFKTLQTDVGTWVFDPMKISRGTIAAKVADGTHGEILGHVEPKSPSTTQVVAALDKSGTEAKTSVVSPENVQAQAKILKEQFPQAQIKIGDESLGREILDNRQAEEPIKSFDSEESMIADLFGSLKNERGSIPTSLKKIEPIELPEVRQAKQYVSELTKARDDLKRAPESTMKEKGSAFLADVKKKIVDSASPMEDAIALAQKTHGFEVLPKYDLTHQIDKALRAGDQAGQFVKDAGLETVIKNVDDINLFDQYLIARHNKTLIGKGIKKGRNLVEDENLVNTFKDKYEPMAKQVTAYSRRLLDYSVDSGLISQELSTKLKKMYPDYVPMKVVFTELEKKTGNFNTKAVASLSKQGIVKKIVGSERAIESPIQSLLEQTYDAFSQGEKNKAGRILAGYKDLPGMKDLIREIEPGEKVPYKFSFLDEGKKRTFETTKEIESAAKSLDVEQLSVLGQILATPIRVKKTLTTGVNPAFAASNVIRDQLTGFVNAKNLGVANPKVFVKALMSALKHDGLYEELVRNGAGGTSFDIARNQIPKTINRIRANKTLGSKIKYTVTHPTELWRAVENIASRSEELTRLQQFEGTRRSLLKQGRTPEDATILASKAARENTANFNRIGDWGRTMRGATLYLSSGIQGSRAFVRSMQRSPLATSAKIATAVLLPTAMATSWNLSDPERKKVYSDIEDYEKENNIIIVPPNPKKDDKGRWNVIKMPLPQGISNFTIPVRRFLEDASGLDPVKFGEIASGLVGTVSPVDPTTKSIVSTLTPPQILPTIEGMANYSFFKGRPQVNPFMEKLPPEKQVYDWTSGTARQVGKVLGKSPIKVEEFTKGTLGGAAPQIIHYLDTLMNKAGVIPENQIGGQSTLDAVTSRFTKAQGGRLKRKRKQNER